MIAPTAPRVTQEEGSPLLDPPLGITHADLRYATLPIATESG